MPQNRYLTATCPSVAVFLCTWTKTHRICITTVRFNQRHQVHLFFDNGTHSCLDYLVVLFISVPTRTLHQYNCNHLFISAEQIAAVACVVNNVGHSRLCLARGINVVISNTVSSLSHSIYTGHMYFLLAWRSVFLRGSF